MTALRPADGGGGTVTLADGSTLRAQHVLVGCAPTALPGLVAASGQRPEGSQTKVNLVLDRLPRCRSGLDSATGFGGTLHLAQGYQRLDAAYDEARGPAAGPAARRGVLPQPDRPDDPGS